MHTAHEFVISFLQMQAPLVFEESDLNKVETLKSKCVSRIIVSPARIPSFIDVLIKNWGRYTENMQRQEEAQNAVGESTTEDEPNR